MTNFSQPLRFYGTSWCYTSRRARATLDELKVPYEYIDIDSDMEGRKFVEQVNNGNRSVPTIVFPDGSILVEPTLQQLRDKLGVV